jgi:hypothetical protein
VLATVGKDLSHSVQLIDIETTLVALSTALAELLRRQPRVILNEELAALVESLDGTAQAINDDAASITSQRIASRTGGFRTMIARVNGLLSPAQDLSSGHFDQGSAYPRGIEPPCGRHDNDKASITDMAIFPTRAEIMSDVADYLPFTSPDQPHHLLDRSERHIDTHFRLLRHDIFAEFKIALANVMKALAEKHSLIKNSKVNFGDLQVYSYATASINHIIFNRRSGLQGQISFSQPDPVRKKSAGNRRKWWEDSKRLEEGILLSFIWIEDSVVQHLFLTVSARNTDPAEKNSLTNMGDMATITTKLLSQDQPSVQALIHSSCQGSKGLLLEYPRILPATFVPVLESLQNMQRLGRLPFQEFIVPDRAA